MKTSSILTQLEAENLLAGSHILAQITHLRDSLTQRSDGQVISYDDYYERIQRDLDSIQRLELKIDIAPGGEQEYSIGLLSSLDQINGDANRVHNKALAFLAKLKSARGAIKELVASFSAWYGLAAAELITDNGIKLTAANIKALGESEFSRLMGGMVTEVDSLITAVSIQAEQAKEHKKTQAEKFKLGEKQVQQSYLVNHMPSYRNEISDAPPVDILRKIEKETEEEDMPAFVSQNPKFTEPVVPPVEEFVKPVTAPRTSGFVKLLPAQPVTVIAHSIPLEIKPAPVVSPHLEALAHEIAPVHVHVERETVVIEEKPMEPAPVVDAEPQEETPTLALEEFLPLERILELVGGEVAPTSPKLEAIPARKPLILDPEEEDFL
jgi:hypothetical protein